MNNKSQTSPFLEPLTAKSDNLSTGDFRSRVLDTVTSAVPETQSRWAMSADAERRAMKVVSEGVQTACEISVALSRSKAEADRHITDAEKTLAAGDPAAIGSHLQERVAAIDSALSIQERDRWEGTSRPTRKFVAEKFGDLCIKLDASSRDRGLVEYSPDLRKSLFPKVAGSECKIDSARGSLVDAGDKGVSDFLVSSTAKSAFAAEYRRSKEGPAAPLRAASMIQNLRREDSPNVCMR